MAAINISKDNFQKEVIESKVPVLLDFWAPWCGPCRMVSPVLDDIANEVQDIKVCKINSDEQPALAAKFGISSIPTLIVMKSGEIVTSSIGVQPKNSILKMLGK